MPNIRVKGKVIKFSDSLSQDDLTKAVSKVASQLGGNQEQPIPTEVKQPSFLERLGKFTGESLSLPFRGFKGLGVGVEQSMRGKTPYESLQRASAATQPGYAPQEGEKIGSFVGSVAPLAPLGLGAGAIGAGLGAMSEDLASGKSISDASLSGGITSASALAGGRLLQGAAKAVGVTGDLLSSAYRQRLSTVKGISRDVVDTVLDNANSMTKPTQVYVKDFFDKILSNRTNLVTKLKSEADKPITGALPEDILTSGINLVKNLRNQSYQMTEDASSKLTNTPRITREELLAPIKSLASRFTIRGEEFGQAATRAVSSLQRWADDITKITEGVEGPQMHSLLGRTMGKGQNRGITEVELKELIRRIDDDVVWDGPANEPIKKVLRGVRAAYDTILKQNTDYKKAISPVSSIINTADKLDDALGLSYGRGGVIEASDQSLGKVTSIIRGKKAVSEEALTDVGFRNLIESGRKRLSDTKVKQEVLNLLSKESKTSLPQESTIVGLAEAASRSGRHSSQHMKLKEVLTKVYGESEAERLSSKIVESKSKELFSHKKSGTLSTGVLDNVFAFLGKMDIEKLQNIDRVLNKVSETSIPSKYMGLPSAGFGELVNRLREKRK